MHIIPLWGVSFEANSYLVVEGSHAVLIDAGVMPDRVQSALLDANATLERILLTHGHFDHTFSVDKLRRTYSLPLTIHEQDAEMLTDASKSEQYRFFGTTDAHEPAEITVSDRDVIPFGDTFITVIHTPGHSRGSVCYRIGDALFSGDTLFASGYGRYDLYGGDSRALSCSLQALGSLDPALTLYPGHGGAATLGDALDNLTRIL